MKLNKIQLEAILSTIVDKINESRDKKVLELINSDEFKRELEEKEGFINSLSQEQLELITFCNRRNMYSNISPKDNVKEFILQKYKREDDSLLQIHRSSSNINFIKIKNEIILSSISEKDLDELINSIVNKF